MPATVLSHIWYKKLFKNIDKIITTSHTSLLVQVPKDYFSNFTSSAWKYPYLEFVWSNDPQSYAGGSNATGGTCHARQVTSDDPDKKGYPGPPEWGLGVGLTTPPHKTYLLLNFNQSPRMGNKSLWRLWLRSLDSWNNAKTKADNSMIYFHTMLKFAWVDINAKFWQEREYYTIIGTHSLHKTSNENGK
jgi:hypothetical protein